VTRALQNLMQVEVSRKEFFGLLGLVLLSVLGFEVILKLLTGKSVRTREMLREYGNSGSVYGGAKKGAGGI
jgi:hypothetical protein